MQVQMRRGTSAEHATFIGVVGEVTYNTTTKTLHTHDGVTTGGTPLVNTTTLQLPRGYYGSAGISNNLTDASNDIDFSTGQWRDSTDTANIILTAAKTKRLDANWVAGDGNGGLDTGSVSASAQYSAYVILNPTSGVVDCLFSTSPTSPTLPTGYTKFRRVGSFYRLSSVNVPFKQLGNKFLYKTQVTDRNSTSAFASALFALSVPSGIVCEPLLSCNIQQAAVTGTCRMTISDGQTGVTNTGASATTYASGGYANFNIDGGVFVDALGKIILEVAFTGSGALTGGFISTRGWIDTLL